MTIDQIKTDIESGKCKRIYFSAHTLWWTHLDEDLISAGAAGKKAQAMIMDKRLKDTRIPAEERTRMSGLFEIAKKSSIPLDPSGSPLMQMENPAKWISEAELKPEHFGKHGLAAFLKAHHQNCGGLCFQDWNSYNLLCEKN